MKIISADWGGVDVTDKIYKWFVRNNEIHLSADNHYLTDTNPGVEKILKIRIEGDDGIQYYYEVNEGANLLSPSADSTRTTLRGMGAPYRVCFYIR